MSLRDRLDRSDRGARVVPDAAAPPRPPSPPAHRAPAGAPLAQRQAAVRAEDARLDQAKAAIHARLVERHADQLDVSDRAAVMEVIARLTDEYLRESGLSLNRPAYESLMQSVLHDSLGLGPLEELLADGSISEIMVNNAHQVFVERSGVLSESPVTFKDEDQLRQVINRIVNGIGRRVDESSPMVDARLKDGSRVNVVLPPLVLGGACLTIRRFPQRHLEATDLMDNGMVTEEILRYLVAAVRTRLNVLISGGTSTGKTTMLNVLSGFIHAGERVITVEDAAELRLLQKHVITMEARPPNVEGIGEVTVRDLVRNALRMRPDRIVVGECRGGEALDMLQAMNTGHEGSMSTIHANSPADALSRLETMALMAGMELPVRAIRTQIASAINVVVQLQRVQGGARRLISVAEVTGLREGEFQHQEIFAWRQVGVTAEGAAAGFHTPTGAQSAHLERFRVSGEALPEEVFRPVDRPDRVY